MRKIYLSLLTMFMGIALSYGQADRVVLVEEFTNAGCGPCAQQNPDFNVVLDNAGATVIPIKYQTAGPGFDPNNVINPEPVNARAVYYSIQGVPTALVDGKQLTGAAYEGAPANVTAASLTSKAEEKSPVTLAITHSFNDEFNKVNVNVAIENVSDSDIDVSNTRLFVALTEKEMNFPFAPGTNGEKEFTDVFRAFVNDGNGNGEAISELKSGATWTKDYSVDLPFFYDYREINVIGFIQDNSNKAILQAGETASQIEFSNVVDVAIESATEVPSSSLCLAEIDYKVKLTNTADQTVNSITFDVNNGDEVLFTKELVDLNLAEGEEKEVSLGIIDLSGGTYNLDFALTDVNGVGSRDMNVLNNYDEKTNIATFSQELVEAIDVDFEDVTAPGTGVLISDKESENQIATVNKAYLSQFNGIDPVHPLGGYGESNSSLMVLFYSWDPSVSKGERYVAYGKFNIKDFVDPVLLHDRASADYNQGPNNDGYAIQVSEDCGDTWTTIFDISGNAMRTAPGQEAIYLPGPDQWTTDTISLSDFSDSEELSLRFLFSSGYGNNLYIDNVKVVNNTTSVEDFNNHNSLSLYPNPASDYVKLAIEMDETRDVSLDVYSTTGVLVDSKAYGKNSGKFTLEYDVQNLTNGMYFFTIKTDGLERTERVHILK